MTITTITNGIFDAQILRYDSEGFKVTPSIDFTGYVPKYYIKEREIDKDADAIVTIEPTFSTVETITSIIVAFPLTTFDDLPKGNYYHVLKVASADGQTAKTIFRGELKVLQDYAKYPVAEAS